ncbi:bis-aminopropyl spermidine synthase family protein [Aeromicrobium sp. S22]|uniref:bis-aminopropyl spermidine synthase family protein n=1 Tax=Aeromicrobium sp. S22 TaxID=2662029 RepID=UPI00281541CA|nr:bis-aminopropyl spermidine synthase family protein [Aeromicrobium sp. S22]
MSDIDLRAAINAVSDVVQNRPPPLREFDQIYMKTGDMVMQSEFVSRWADSKRLAFVGDGDAISVCVAHMHSQGILETTPSEIVVFDFDERMVNSVNRFAEAHEIPWLSAQLYNCLDPLPPVETFDYFYTNPPWGASNQGSSVHLFMRRGFELTNYRGDGVIVIGDDAELEWTKEVLQSCQSYGLAANYYVSRMMPQLHSYHLDDAPLLRSCNLIFSPLSNGTPASTSTAVDPVDLDHFYGSGLSPEVRYVRDTKLRDPSHASSSDYRFDRF